MSGVTFTLNDADLQAGLGRLERAAAQPREAYHAIGAHFVFSTQRNIELETAPSGSRWPALSPRTAAGRIGKGRRGTEHMLRVTNRLYASISYQVQPDGVSWGTNLVYGRIHQLGGVVDMPERQATVRLRQVRVEGGGVRSRFASNRAKKVREVAATIGAHQVRVPARPYLGVSQFDRQRVPEIMADHLEQAVRR